MKVVEKILATIVVVNRLVALAFEQLTPAEEFSLVRAIPEAVQHGNRNNLRQKISLPQVEGWTNTNLATWAGWRKKRLLVVQSNICFLSEGWYVDNNSSLYFGAEEFFSESSLTPKKSLEEMISFFGVEHSAEAAECVLAGIASAIEVFQREHLRITGREFVLPEDVGKTLSVALGAERYRNLLRELEKAREEVASAKAEAESLKQEILRLNTLASQEKSARQAEVADLCKTNTALFRVVRKTMVDLKATKSFVKSQRIAVIRERLESLLPPEEGDGLSVSSGDETD